MKARFELAVEISKLKAPIFAADEPVALSRISKLPEEPGAAEMSGAEMMKSARAAPAQSVATSTVEKRKQFGRVVI